MAKFKSTKTYGHDLGFSAAFRQWRADSHCKYIHGYALAFRFEFEADELDARNWVVDFGGLKGLKAMLENTFDHKLLVAQDDPEIEWFREAHKRGIADIVEVEAGGCEKFAEHLYNIINIFLFHETEGRVKATKVEVYEHERNSSSYEG
jgi:6-pyruvoyltetrahydropterin/6-carboxytetrahydropterin synthase